MEFPSVVEFLDNKAILVTGATGFLAKIFLEKVLRVHPNVKKFYLLLRAPDTESAKERLRNEVHIKLHLSAGVIIEKDLFRVLKEKWGPNLYSLISEKITVVPGDVSLEDLGLKDSSLMEELRNQVDIILNFAATTNFYERYDVALGINAFGAKHVLSFAKTCVRIPVLVHVSTAYVCGEKGGLIEEKPYQMGETLNGTPGLDVEAEKKLVQEKLNDCGSRGDTEEEIKLAMKEMGIARAKVFGWPNTYAFTKAMGEMLIGSMKQELSVVIIRPTIITSTYKEPFPGWIEGARTIDSIVIGYGKGKISCFVGDLNSIVDLIPADFVVNATISVMAAHANRPSDVIYQVGSSVKNHLTYHHIQDFAFRYFSGKPFINKDGKAIKVRKLLVLSDMDSFRKYMGVRHLLLLKGLGLLNATLCQHFQGTYDDLNRKINRVMRLAELYRPYLFFKGTFDDMNSEKLRMAIRENGVEADAFCFDPKCVDWEDYLLNIHFPALAKYVF